MFIRVPSVFTRVLLVFIRVPSVFTHVPLVFIRVPSVFTRVPLVFIRVPSVFTRVPLVFIRVPSVFTRVSLVFIRVPSVFTRGHSCSIGVHSCSDLCGVLDMTAKISSLGLHFISTHFFYNFTKVEWWFIKLPNYIMSNKATPFNLIQIFPLLLSASLSPSNQDKPVVQL